MTVIPSVLLIFLPLKIYTDGVKLYLKSNNKTFLKKRNNKKGVANVY
jgi:hypothetical protein